MHIHCDFLTTSSPAEGKVLSIGGNCSWWRMRASCLITLASVSIARSVWQISQVVSMKLLHVMRRNLIQIHPIRFNLCKSNKSQNMGSLQKRYMWIPFFDNSRVSGSLLLRDWWSASESNRCPVFNEIPLNSDLEPGLHCSRLGADFEGWSYPPVNYIYNYIYIHISIYYIYIYIHIYIFSGLISSWIYWRVVGFSSGDARDTNAISRLLSRWPAKTREWVNMFFPAPEKICFLDEFDINLPFLSTNFDP